jgi:hypothetical protein
MWMIPSAACVWSQKRRHRRGQTELPVSAEPRAVGRCRPRTESGGVHRRQRPSNGRGCGRRVAPPPQPRSRRQSRPERERRHGQADGRRGLARLPARADLDWATARATAATRWAQAEANSGKLLVRSLWPSARARGRRRARRRRKKPPPRGRASSPTGPQSVGDPAEHGQPVVAWRRRADTTIRTNAPRKTVVKASKTRARTTASR